MKINDTLRAKYHASKDDLQQITQEALIPYAFALSITERETEDYQHLRAYVLENRIANTKELRASPLAEYNQVGWVGDRYYFTGFRAPKLKEEWPYLFSHMKSKRFRRNLFVWGKLVENIFGLTALELMAARVPVLTKGSRLYVWPEDRNKAIDTLKRHAFSTFDWNEKNPYRPEDIQG